MKRDPRSRGNDPMEFYRQILLARKAEVVSNLGVKFDTLAGMGRVAEEDQAQMSHDEHISLSLNSLDFQQLGLVEEALDRIKMGDYGFCQACGGPIAGKRIKAVPWARYCITCQEQTAEPAGSYVDTPEMAFDR
jgi:RNA polymerase-binding protein DksA